MTGFSSRLEVRAHEPGEWLVIRPLQYAPRQGKPITVPAGFITDLASIPRLLRSVYDTQDECREPAVLHDYLYCVQFGERAEADALFLEALERAGVGLLKRRSMWLGVRAGGWMYWRKREGDSIRGDFAEV